MTKEFLQEIDELLMISYRGAFKAWTMYQRHEMQRRAEIDDLIGIRDRLIQARKRLQEELK